MEDAITYILAALLLAFGTSGITYFWTRKKEKAHRKDERERQNDKLAYICEKFDLMEACQRDTATIQLMDQTDKYKERGTIPRHTKTLLLNICNTLHRQGANGDVSQCELDLKGIESED